jgi:hypothetical protein
VAPRLAAAALDIGEDAVEKAIAESRDRLLDAADVDEVAATPRSSVAARSLQASSRTGSDDLRWHPDALLRHVRVKPSLTEGSAPPTHA